MKTYLALLRGINVSGQKKIIMTDLQILFQECNCKDVRTYIQSGNVIFKHENIRHEDLKRKIEQMIYEKYGFEVAIVLLNTSELDYVISNNPFLKDSDKDNDRHYITFLSEFPLPLNMKNLSNPVHPQEEFILDGKTIYLFLPNGYGKAKMNNTFFENKLKVKATTRNWKTVNTLMVMAKEK